MRADAVLPAGTWDTAAEIDRVLIDFDRRHRRRILLRTEQGREVLLDLPQAVRLRDGDGLAVEWRRGAGVRAGRNRCWRSTRMMRAKWCGSPGISATAICRCSCCGDRIRIRADHVIREMVEGLGGHVDAIEAPFDPEAGAYAGGHHHHHHDD